MRSLSPRETTVARYERKYGCNVAKRIDGERVVGSERQSSLAFWRGGFRE